MRTRGETCSLRTVPLCETSEMSVSLRWKLPDPLAWVSTAIGRQLEPGQGEAMVTFLFPFGKGGRRRPGCPSGKECGEQWAETLKHLRAWLPYLTQAPPSGSLWGRGREHTTWSSC